jgi:glycosyltransferase involved in cell wall biosynthesis
MKIAVIVPVFNAEATLAETLASIHAQSRPADEVIVVDDGSRDAAAALAEAHPLAPRVLRLANGGAAAAMNAGVAAAGADLIAFLDSDDLWTPDALVARLAAMTADADIVLGAADSFLCPSVPEDAARGLSWRKGRQRGFLGGAMLARRDVFDAIGPFDAGLRTGFFVDWFDRAVRAGVRVVHVDAPCLMRRVRPGTLGRRGGPDDRLSRDMLEIARRRIAERRANG